MNVPLTGQKDADLVILDNLDDKFKNFQQF